MQTARRRHFLTVWDVEAFMDRTEYDTRIEAFIREIKSQPLAQGFDEIFYPGEIEARAAEINLREGLRLPADTWQDLAIVAAEIGAQDLLEASRVTAGSPAESPSR